MRLKPGTILHQCADCDYWEPALTYFGEPTGQGGCRFSVARNRKGDLLRECENYKEANRQMGTPEDVTAEKYFTPPDKELDALIHSWRDSLAEHRLLMSPSTVYLVEQTIKALQELQGLVVVTRSRVEV